MPRRFYELSSDVQTPGRWYLGDPLEGDPWQFTEGGAVHVEGRLEVPIYKHGRPLDFSLTGTGIPIAHARTATLFTELAPDDVQFLPVEIAGQPEQFGILVATRLIRCVDDQRSTEVLFWKPEDGQPDKVGEYRSIYGLRIDPTQAGAVRVFRPWGWPVALIVSEDLKEALERAKATGVKFTEV